MLPNWFDLILVILVWRGAYGGLDRGAITELFMLAGAVCITALTFNYGPVVSDWARPWMMGDPRADFAIFGVLFLNLVLMTRIIYRRLAPATRFGQNKVLLHIIGLVFGAARGVWWCGVLTVVLTSTGWTYLSNSVTQRSLIGSRLTDLARKEVTRAVGYFPGSQYRRADLIPPLVIK